MDFYGGEDMTRLKRWLMNRALRSDQFGVYRVMQATKVGDDGQSWCIEKWVDNFQYNGDKPFEKEWQPIITCYSIADALKQVNIYKADAAYEHFKQQRRLNNADRRARQGFTSRSNS